MNLPVSALVRSVFDKESLEDCTLEEIRAIAEKYPYFLPARLLLVARMKLEGDDAAGRELEKTSLYFQNPVWYHHIVSDPVTVEMTREEDQTPEDRDDASEDTEAATEVMQQLPVPVPEEVVPQPEQTANGPDSDGSQDSFPEIQTGAATESETTDQTPPPPAEEAKEMEEESQPGTTDLMAGNEEQLVATSETVDNTAATETAGDEEVRADAADQPPSAENEEEPVDDQSSDPPEEAWPADPETPHAALPGLGDLKIELAPTDPHAPAFEPLFTVDYFASQGIRAPEQEQPSDNFGKQLRSFTEWLKTMKKLSTADIEKTVTAGSEEKVIDLANVSNKPGDVLTETMAEVWVRQGNLQKARDIYNKLSLLNPDKSAYFAAKIEELK